MSAPVRQMRIEDPETAAVLLDPTRRTLLTHLREPASASGLARTLGLPAARVNHHVKRLRDVGLVQRVGTRRVRNLTEVLYRALARTYVVAESLTPGGDRRRSLREDDAKRPLRNLVALGERLAGDSLILLDRAACDDEEFSTFSTSVDLEFRDAGARAAFLADLLEAVRTLRAKYGARTGGDECYKAVVACYPDVER